MTCNNFMKIDNILIAHLCCTGLVLLLSVFLVILRMFMDREGCYYVRDKKLIAHKLTSIVNFFGIATSPCAEKVLVFSDISTK
jgi:hypothetical protein